MDKAKGVMEALKGRKGFDSKKGVNLLGIVKKLSAKRKALKEDPEEKGEKEDKKESKKEEESEDDEKDGKGGPGFMKMKPSLVDDSSTQKR